MVPDFIAHNWPYKLLAIFFATLVWFFVSGSEPIQTSITTRVAFKGEPDKIVVDQSDEEIKLHLRGPISSVIAGDIQQITMKPIDLTGYAQGASVITLTEDNFRNIPNGLNITQIVPARLVIEIDTVTSRIIGVSPRIVGKPAPGYAIASTAVSPPVITLKGARNQLESIEQIVTEEINVDGLRGELKRTVKVVRPDITVLEMEVDQVTVTLQIRERMVEQVFRQTPVWADPPAWVASYALIPGSVTYRLHGPQPLLETLDLQSAVQARIGWEAMPPPATAGELRRQVPVKVQIAPEYRDRLQVQAVEPETLTLTLQARPVPEEPEPPAPDPKKTKKAGEAPAPQQP